VSEGARIEEERSFAWRCFDDDPGFAMDKLDQLVNELRKRVEELEKENEYLFMLLPEKTQEKLAEG
jgi:hypothetical protein